MTILTIEKKKFEKEIAPLNEEMKEKIAMFGTPIDAERDDEIDIELFPNRPDLISYQNFKNAFLTYLGKKSFQIKINKPEKDYIVKIDPSLKDIRPFTACAIVKGLKLNDEKIKELIDIQEKLHISIGRKRKKAAIGIYPLDKISLPITFTAREPEKIKFQPLEFPKEINGKQILSQHPTGRDYGNLLQGLTKYPIFIDNNNEILSMPPIINSHKTGKISIDTKEVFVECSGSHLETLKKILNIVVLSLASMNGKVYQMKLIYEDTSLTTPDFSEEKMKLSKDRVNALLGLNLKESEISSLLKKMGHTYNKGTVSIPAQRTDILHENDLIEDIAIAYGYNRFTPKIPEIATLGEIDKKQIVKSKIAEILTGLELLETSSFHLTTLDAQYKKLGRKPENFMQVENSKTEYNILRENLSHYLLKILSENIDVEYPQNIFQIGTVFENYNEKESLAIALSPGNFTKLKQILNYLERMLNVTLEIRVPKTFPESLIEGRAGEIFFNEKPIGFIGETHPKVLTNLKIKMPVSILEINLDEILEIL